MKKIWLLSVTAVFCAASALGACSSDDSSGDGDGDGSGGSSNTGGTDGEGGATMAGIPCVAADGVDDAVCVNDTDCPLIEDDSLRGSSKDCLLNECIGSDDKASCVSECTQKLLGSTAACSMCYGTSSECGFDNCLAECAADDRDPACQTCLYENDCAASLFACSGLAVPE